MKQERLKQEESKEEIQGINQTKLLGAPRTTGSGLGVGLIDYLADQVLIRLY